MNKTAKPSDPAMRNEKTSYAETFPCETNAMDAKQGIREGKQKPVVLYLDAATILLSLAQLADKNEETNSAPWRLKFVPVVGLPDTSSPKPDADEEWEGDSHQIRQAIDRGNIRAVGWYLADLSQVIGRLAVALEGDRMQEWRLQFIRTRRGRPSKLMTTSKKS